VYFQPQFHLFCRDKQPRLEAHHLHTLNAGLEYELYWPANFILAKLPRTVETVVVTPLVTLACRVLRLWMEERRLPVDMEVTGEYI
jgi:hypothetical protein